MNEKALILFLQIVKGNGVLDELLKKGFDYSQIVNFITETKKSGFVKDVPEQGLVVTSQGAEVLKRLNLKYARYNSAQWISPDDNVRIEKKHHTEIFVPKKGSFKLR